MSMNGGGPDAISAQQQSNNTASIGSYAPNAKANRAVSQPVDNHSVSRRLQSELMSLMTCGDPGISAFPDGDNIFSWIGTIKGSRSTVYEGLSYKMSLKFPTDYPFKPPGVKFDTACFHPNVDQYGNICLDILQETLCPVTVPQCLMDEAMESSLDIGVLKFHVKSPEIIHPLRGRCFGGLARGRNLWPPGSVGIKEGVIFSLGEFLLTEPNNDSPLNSYAAALWDNQEEYRKVNCKQYRDGGGVIAASR